MNSAWLFNLGADMYAWFTAQAAWRGSCARLAEQLGAGEARRIVDLGCGPGVSTFAIAQRRPDATVVGVDVAPRMLAQARQRRRTERITWLQADAARLPLATASVDACTGHSFLYLVADRTAVLSEIRRVLRPGGQLVLMEPREQGAALDQVLALSRDPRHLLSVSLWRPFSRLHGRFSARSLQQTLAEAGFVDCLATETLNGLGLLATARR
jgi:ubiquinone/menaquinone biosynthesis C-methylase UbiE